MKIQMGIQTAVAVLAVVVCLVAFPSCKRKESTPSSASAASIRKDRYTVRGVVVVVPSADNPAAEFQVRHEAMPHFVGQDGELGMDTMTMPFPLAEGLSLDAVKPGDKIELSFEVDFDTRSKQLMGYRATAVTLLPPETTLDFTSMKR